MKIQNRIFHEAVIRLLKGILKAYETWLLSCIKEDDKK